ncbi:MAG: hypothetical protein SPE35_10245, partial [Butyricicoccus sp.]|nr:hypothetical protein [Butyricicoccus sp.]
SGVEGSGDKVPPIVGRFSSDKASLNKAIYINASQNSGLNSGLFRQKVCSHLCIYFAKIFPNEFLRTTGHTTAEIPA